MAKEKKNSNAAKQTTKVKSTSKQAQQKPQQNILAQTKIGSGNQNL